GRGHQQLGEAGWRRGPAGLRGAGRGRRCASRTAFLQLFLKRSDLGRRGETRLLEYAALTRRDERLSNPLQLFRELARGGEPLGGILRERAIDGGDKLRRQSRYHRFERRRLLVQELHDD